jgi:hypothetical protein
MRFGCWLEGSIWYLAPLLRYPVFMAIGWVDVDDVRLWGSDDRRPTSKLLLLSGVGSLLSSCLVAAILSFQTHFILAVHLPKYRNPPQADCGVNITTQVPRRGISL